MSTVIVTATPAVEIVPDGSPTTPVPVPTATPGQVTGPSTNTDGFVPRWNGANLGTLADGVGIGTAAQNLVQLDGQGRLPAVDGSQLAGLYVGRLRLTADTIYFVRPDGSDSNDGLTNTAAGALRTIQRAVNTVAGLDTNGHTVTIQIADGTYTEAVILKDVVGVTGVGQLVIQGNAVTPANVVVSAPGSGTIFTASGLSVTWDLFGLKLQVPNGDCLNANRSPIRFGNLVFGDAGRHVIAQNSALVTAASGYAIAGTASTSHLLAASLGAVNCNSISITLVGTPSLTVFAAAQILAGVSMAFTSFSGSATGQRYSVVGNAVINTNGGGPAFLPGDAVGSTTLGGQYI